MGGEELREGCACRPGVFVVSRVGHDGARMLVKDDECILVAVFVRGIIVGQNDVVGSK